MKKTIIAAAVIALTTACGNQGGGNAAKGPATNASVADHDEAAPTKAAENEHGHAHEGNQADHPH